MSEYPNREHKNADDAAKRRALSALASLDDHVAILRMRINTGQIMGDDAARLYDAVHKVTLNCAVLDTLRDVREWHAADQADRP